MGKEILMIFVPPNQYLFVEGINEKSEFVYRVSDDLKTKRKESFLIENGWFKTDTLEVPVYYLTDFLKLNKQ